MIEADHVVKHFGDVHALNGITLSVDEGEIFGLLGPNGAGKTTLVRILATLLKPTSGSCRLGGIDAHRDPMAVRALIGLAGQNAAVDDLLTGRENLEIVGRLYQLSRTEARRRAGDNNVFVEKVHVDYLFSTSFFVETRLATALWN